MPKPKEEPPPTPVEVPQLDLEPEEPPNLKHIRITILGFKNVVSLFLVSELEVRAVYLDNELGITARTHVIDDNNIPVSQQGNHEFVLECNISSRKDLDKLISNPLLLTVTEIPCTINEELVQQLEAQKKPLPQVINLSAASEADLASAFTGKAVDKSNFIDPKSSSKADSSKTSAKSGGKDVKKEPSKDKLAEDEVKIPTEPTLMGTAVLDLLPLFLEQRDFVENLPISQAEKFYDDRIVPNKIMPRLVVKVTIDEEEWFPEDPNANILNITVESLYNIPNLMSEEMQYKISTLLPTTFGKTEHMVFKSGKFRNIQDENKMKKWPEIMNTFGITTQYRLDEFLENIKNPIGANLDVVKNPTERRIQWNIMKRVFYKADGSRELTKIFFKYRRLPIELYVSSLKDEPPKVEPPSSDAGKKGKEAVSAPVKVEPENYLHLMSTVDVSTLLYPGVKRCRVLCPFNTYNEKEMFDKTGMDDSYFFPKKILAPPSLGLGGGDKKGSAKDSRGSEKPGKVGAGDAGDNKRDLKPMLPPPPVEPEPSKLIYNEKGERAFVIIEVELTEALTPKRPIEDLRDELSQIIPKKPEMPRIVISSKLATIYFQNVVKELADDLTHQYQHYLVDKEECKCELPFGAKHSSFISYLQKSGVYQTYLISITKAAAVIVNDRFPYTGEVSLQSKEYQNFISEIYCALIKEMNVVLNKIMSVGVEEAPKSPLMKLDSTLFYAREACELGATLLAERYYLERISSEENTDSCWFDYALFKLELGEHEHAFECVKESLAINCKHQYSLMLFGILLGVRKKFEEAETCFLTVVFQNQTWVEGWGAMNVFYTDSGNTEGADLCLEMANKYLMYSHETEDYFNSVDDIVWTTELCPKTVFMKTAMLLIKMRALEYAKKALARELVKYTGIVYYYLAVIEYYRKNYEQALVYLKESEDFHGSDYAVASLTGHCYLQQGKLEASQEQYTRVLESYNRPDDVHLLFVYLALIWEKLHDKQSARQLLLLACKYSPTPYTWLSCGLLYYSQRDLLSAEECLIQANLCDNRLPEIWGYLTVLNLELGREDEAELCYRQAKKHDMKNPDLTRRIKELTRSKNVSE